MDYQDIKTKTVVELRNLIQEKNEELRDLRFKIQNQQLKANHKVQLARKMIARLNTALKVAAKQ